MEILIIYTVLLLLLCILLWVILDRIQKTKGNVNELFGKWGAFWNWVNTYLRKTITNNRKRDEKMRRAITGLTKQENQHYKYVLDKFSDADSKMDNLIKKVELIYNVMGECKNESKKTASNSLATLKELKKHSTAIDSLDKIVKSSKRKS